MDSRVKPGYGGFATVLFGVVLLSLLMVGAASARAGVLDRVRREGVLHCGAEARSAVAEDRGDGTIGGLAVDLCRAVALSAAGPRAKIVFRFYNSARSFDAVRSGGDELFFLTPDVIADQNLAARITAGPKVFTVRLSLLAPLHAAAQHPRDLAGQPICFMIASDAQRALDAAFRGWGRDFVHMAFEEEDEMRDAYEVQRCTAMAGEASELGRLRGRYGVNGLTSRVLTPPLAAFPLIAATPAGDRPWAAWVRHALGAKTTP